MNAEQRRAALFDVPVFDAGRAPITIHHHDDADGWSAGRGGRLAGVRVRFPGDGPTIEHRIEAGRAWYSSGRYSGQAANDNQDWPLAKLLKTEGNDRCMRLAQLYRQIHDGAYAVVDLVGREPDDLPEAHRLDIDESTGALRDKGPRRVGKVVPNPGLRTDTTHVRALSKPLPKAWAGDWPLLNRIDCRPALDAARGALGWLVEPFESAVVGGETLRAIGEQRGIKNKVGAQNAGRALVFLGFDAIEAHWRQYPVAA